MFIYVGNPDRTKILVVDDEPAIVESVADLFRKTFRVLGTTDTERALETLAAGDIALVLADQRMPQMTGAELLARSAVIAPDTVRVMLTGYSDISAVIEAVNKGRIYQYVTKPWDPAALLDLVQRATLQSGLVAENRRLVRELATLTTRTLSTSPDDQALRQRERDLRAENEALRVAYEQLDKSYWHLEKIQEVLPICMGCGNVKSEALRWEPVLDYLKANSTFLSHGYCPDCVAKVCVDL